MVSIFLIITIALLAYIALSVFFIVFGTIKKMNGFLITGIIMIVLIMLSVVAMFMLNMIVVN